MSVAQTPASNSGRDNHRNRLHILTATQLYAARFHVNAFDVHVGPKIKIGFFHSTGKGVKKLRTVRSFKSWIVVYIAVNRMELAANPFVLLEHERVQTKLIAPQRG